MRRPRRGWSLLLFPLLGPVSCACSPRPCSLRHCSRYCLNERCPRHFENSQCESWLLRVEARRRTSYGRSTAYELRELHTDMLVFPVPPNLFLAAVRPRLYRCHQFPPLPLDHPIQQTNRKGVAKAQAKFEPTGRLLLSQEMLYHAEVLPLIFSPTPTVFRDDLIRSLSAVDSKDYESYNRVLETLANELDFKKYEPQLFELLILGRLLAPGGNLALDGEECPLSLLGRDLSEVREVAGVFERLIRRCVGSPHCDASWSFSSSGSSSAQSEFMRVHADVLPFHRYKYLQRPLESSSLPSILVCTEALSPPALTLH